MPNLSDIIPPSNIVYDQRTKRYHDLLMNYKMVSTERVRQIGQPIRADRQESEYVSKQ